MLENIVPELEALFELDCIKKMGDRYRGIWSSLVYKYAPRLNAHPLIREVAYTNHDFSHHCKDIYSIIDKVLLSGIELKMEEYFVLAVSVLLHDIAMTELHFDRLQHSVGSGEYIIKEVENGVEQWQKVPPQHISIIVEIIKGHSDIKELDSEGKENIKVHTLQTVQMTSEAEVKGVIRVRWLAGILRLADELDVTYARLGTAEVRYKDLDVTNEKERKSKQCWERLNYFSAVRREKTNIVLVLNKQYLNKHINDDRVNIVAGIKKVRKDIDKKLNEVNKYAFDIDEEYINYIKIYNVILVDYEEIFREGELDEDLGKDILQKHMEASDEDGPAIVLSQDIQSFLLKDTESVHAMEQVDNTHQNIEKKAMQLRQMLGENISRYIYDRGLIHYGHYRLNRQFCGRNWINVRSLLANPEMGKECIDVIATDLELILEKRDIKNVVAIGVSMNGNIIASRVAFRLGLPFSYIVPKKPGSIGADMEKQISITAGSKVVLFTGVIASFDTIKAVIKDYLQHVEIVAIYTVLWRKMSTEQFIDDNVLLPEIRYLNDDFPCEVIPKIKCMNAKYGRCVARNEQAYTELYEWPLAVKDSKDKRIFINNIIGCNAHCSYCYLEDIGINYVTSYKFDEVKAEFERIPDCNSSEYIISIGCYSECLLSENLDEIRKIIRYFAEKRYYIQISTKRQLDIKWLEEIENILLFRNQLSIYVSMPTLRRATEEEPGADVIEKRIRNFEYVSKENKIKMYLYIKPFLENITNLDTEKYIAIAKQYNLDVIVGEKFQRTQKNMRCMQVGKNYMYEMCSEQIDDFIKLMEKRVNVYRHSVEPIRVEMEKHLHNRLV